MTNDPIYLPILMYHGIRGSGSEQIPAGWSRRHAIDAVFPRNFAICRYFMDLKMKLLRKRHNFFEKSSCVLASRAILLPRNDQRRVTLREKQQPHVAGEFFEDLLNFSLSLR